MKRKLSQIRTPWRRRLITFLVNVLVFLGRHSSIRARVHWLGRQQRPRRLERLLGMFLILGAMLILEPRQLALWSIIWGGFFAISLNLYTVYHLIPRKQYHWIAR